MSRVSSLVGGLAAASLLLLAGCNSGDDDFKPIDGDQPEVPAAAHHHDHGPNDGHVIELGDEEYHAELVFDPESRKTTVYILDGEAKSPHPIAAESIALDLEGDGDEIELMLAASPLESDGEGMSSRFELAAEELPESIKDEEDFEGHVHIKIGETEYTGDIVHDHEHGDGHKHGEGHKHGDHKEGDQKEEVMDEAETGDEE